MNCNIRSSTQKFIREMRKTEKSCWIYVSKCQGNTYKRVITYAQNTL